MRYEKQIYYCPNCGSQLAGELNHNHVKSLMCSVECMREWELKYARMIVSAIKK